MNLLDWKEWQALVAWLVILLGGGAVGRRVWIRRRSDDSVDEAHNLSRTAKAQAETDYFQDAIQRIEKDRDDWKAACLRERDASQQRLDSERRESQELVLSERKLNFDLREQIVGLKGQITSLEAEARHKDGNRRLRLRLFRQQYPEFDTSVLESEAMPLEPRTLPSFAPDSTLER